MKADESPTRVLVVWCPDWPVHAVGAGPDVPAAVLVGEGARATVLACSAAARAAGVRRGQRLRDAQRLCPELRAYPRDEPAEERVFEPVVQAVENVAAGVEVVRPGLIALAAPGPARYHGGEARLALLIREAVADVGIPAPTTPPAPTPTPTLAPAVGLGDEDAVAEDPLGCGIGVADGIFAASLAARLPVDEPLIVPPGGSAAFLAPYPLRVFDRPELDGILERLGIRTLGEFAALPVADVANRFGPVGVLAHRLARGLDPRPPASRRPGEDLSALHLFDPPAERDEQVLFAAKALADRWRDGLATAGLTCASVRIELATEGGGHYARTWRNGDALGATLSSQALAQRVRWQLDGWRTRVSRAGGQRPASGMEEAPPAANQLSSVAEVAADPLVSVRLVPGPLVVDTGSQQTLWGREAVPDRVGRAAERVQAMLGHDGVALLHLTGGRDPAARIIRTPWGEKPPSGLTADPEAPWPGAVPEPAPPLLPEDQPPVLLLDARGTHVEVSGRVGLSAPPAVLVLGGHPLPVTDWAGPWPYHEHPWRPATVRRRARLQLTTADGRAFLVALEHRAWRLEGIYH
ncbi:MAG TPA: DNA polymerase Y family protein [Actinospica sp.]|nr:DNA polymerase Y family protein [Actinospica sp.]